MFQNCFIFTKKQKSNMGVYTYKLKPDKRKIF